ncbi:hypothetical protein HGRIS_001459 [Hohenbuehelia grisea]
MATIPCIVSKPGLPLAAEADCNVLFKRILAMRSEEPLINLTVKEKQSSSGRDKENVGNPGPPNQKKKKTCADPAILPGNVAKSGKKGITVSKRMTFVTADAAHYGIVLGW